MRLGKEVNPPDLVGELQSNIYSGPFIFIVATGTGGTIVKYGVTLKKTCLCRNDQGVPVDCI